MVGIIIATVMILLGLLLVTAGVAAFVLRSKIAGNFRESYIVRFLKGSQHDNDKIEISVKKRQDEKHEIPLANFRQMLKDGMIPDKDDFAKINNMDRRTNMTKSKEEAQEAKWKAETSQDR